MDFTDTESAVTMIYTDNPDPFEAELSIHVINKKVALLPIVADTAKNPGDVRLDKCGVRITRVHHGNFGLERNADGNVAVGAVYGAQDRPDIVFICHFDNFVT